VKLLFDQNLSRRLVGMLSIDYPESSHVTEVGLDTATTSATYTRPSSMSRL
jgi:predicted nuclease of predicted toxin-antitoxin system